MLNPFEYFGISPNASRAELDNAYRQMREKNKCDKNADSLTRDISENKLREIDEVYRQALGCISRGERTAQPSQNPVPAPTSDNPGTQNQNTYNQNNNPKNDQTNKYADFENNYNKINALINSKNFSAAEHILLEYNLVGYAKWHYVFARLRFSQGWMNEALENYKKAYELEPYNQLYRQSYENICNMRDGKIKKHSNKAAVGIAIGIGTFYCCCNAFPYLSETQLCEDCVNETGIASVCLDPCADGISAYCNSLCNECCGGCPG